MGTDLKEYAKAQLSRSFNTRDKFINNQNVSDHHAIIPTEVRADLNTLSPKEQKVYMLIAQSFLENIMPPYQYEAVDIVINIGEYSFSFNGQVPQQLGFKALYDNEQHNFH